MGGKLATGLEEISTDPSSLREPGFWAIVGSFEGQWLLAKFKNVIAAPLPGDGIWSPIASTAWRSSLDKSTYSNYVKIIREEIAAGGVYQVNACRVISANNQENKSLLPLARAISSGNPAPYLSYISVPDLEIASASPERFLSLRDRVIISSPIKGTSATPDFFEKDRAENLMIVDLIRNDMGAIAKVGSVTTPRLLAVEEHPGLYHLVSDVKAQIAEGLYFDEVLRSMMPPGSVSGAPKSSALKIIEKQERERDIYCGVLGWYHNGEAEIAVTIRTFWQREDNILHFGTGAGITWGSDPDLEWQETELKAARLINIAAGQGG
ncbi:MAG: anthranilate synthase component I family protein [Candidatus Nanopelagicaceae bacterium]|nr:anthranilate synthase component I family protein [Candidatus Nanopelagicaceae bacterium]